MNIILTITSLLLDMSGHRVADEPRSAGMFDYVYLVIAIPILIIGGIVFSQMEDSKDKTLGICCLIAVVIGAIFFIGSCVH